MKVKQLLAQKAGAVVTIVPNASLKTAVSVLCEKKIGALMVLDEQDKPVGIITERDLLIELSGNHGELGERQVAEAMTRELVCGLPEDDLDYVMRAMTENRIRHLPIVAEGRLVGLISIGDVVKAQLDKSEFENHYLRDYISLGG
ncbi:CBS domain-containing protein [Candidatus Sumerlaeota bacterium]